VDEGEVRRGLLRSALVFPAFAGMIVASYAVHGTIAVGVLVYRFVSRRHPVAVVVPPLAHGVQRASAVRTSRRAPSTPAEVRHAHLEEMAAAHHESRSPL
jgi:hypothetical protein